MKKKKTRRASRAFYAGLSYLSPRWNTKLLYLRKFGRLPDLKHPQTLNEKLLKQKLERFGTDPVVRQCADKYRVRDYVDGCGCGGTVPFCGSVEVATSSTSLFSSTLDFGVSP